jgi:hypothetical protein
METVVEEKPLSLATSRIVTIEPFLLESCARTSSVFPWDSRGGSPL